MTIFLLIYLGLFILAALHIILYGSRPAKSLSWFLIVLVFPFVGVFLYVVFGVNRRKFKFYSLKETTKRKLYDYKINKQQRDFVVTDFENASLESLAVLLENSADFPVARGNEVTLLQEGKLTFETIFEAIESAEKFIHLEYYIFEEGELFDKLLSRLSEKIKQGVEVRILYDEIGSFSLSRASVKKAKRIGAKVYAVMPLKFGSFLFTLNYRNHRKIIIIDGTTGFTGGVNFSDRYIKSRENLGVWDDTHVMIKGPAVDFLHRVFIKDYFFASDGESLLEGDYLPNLESKGNVALQIVAGGPDSPHPSIMQQYIKMISIAREYIYISNPYFIPNNAMLEALRIAALSGVKVKILVPLQSDSWLAKNSMLSSFEELLELGVQVFQQQDNFLHSKVIIIDGEIASVGSGNFDHRSFEHNFEANALLYDEEISKKLCEDFIKDCEDALELTYDHYKNRPLHKKLAEGIARFFNPLL